MKKNKEEVEEIGEIGEVEETEAPVNDYPYIEEGDLLIPKK